MTTRATALPVQAKSALPNYTFVESKALNITIQVALPERFSARELQEKSLILKATCVGFWKKHVRDLLPSHLLVTPNLQGTIEVDSQVGQGTRFIITLPYSIDRPHSP